MLLADLMLIPMCSSANASPSSLNLSFHLLALYKKWKSN